MKRKKTYELSFHPGNAAVENYLRNHAACISTVYDAALLDTAMCGDKRSMARLNERYRSFIFSIVVSQCKKNEQFIFYTGCAYHGLALALNMFVPGRDNDFFSFSLLCIRNAVISAGNKRSWLLRKIDLELKQRLRKKNLKELVNAQWIDAQSLIKVKIKTSPYMNAN